MELTEKTELISSYLEEKNMAEITVIDLTGLVGDMDEFIIATAANERNARACADYLHEKADEQSPIIGTEGYENGKWILVDYGDIIVHLFTEEERSRYDLEKLWASGKFINKRANEKHEQ